MGPVWHGGQAIKGLVLASGLGAAAAKLGWKGAGFNRAAWLATAERAAEFTLRNRETSGPDAGLIHAYENDCCSALTSTQLEGLYGLCLLSNATGDRRYADAALAATSWSLKTLMTGAGNEGLMYDGYNLTTRRFEPMVTNFVTKSGVGRPMSDDSMFLRASRLATEPALKAKLRAAFFRVLDRLIASEGPPGNWGGYRPSTGVNGSQHPRQAFWWGRPFIDACTRTPQAPLFAFLPPLVTRSLSAVHRYRDGQQNVSRRGDSISRVVQKGAEKRRRHVPHEDASFQTTTFGQVTSGSACAAILWIELFQVTKDPALLPDIQKALAFVGESLVTNATDENMRGGVIEDSVDPGKCDASPYHLRDIAASFYMQALSMLLEGAAAELT